MPRFLILALVALLLSAKHACARRCSNTVQKDVKWKCAVTGQCQLQPKVKVSSQQACFNMCNSKYECKCAFYRPSDKTCHLKTKACDDPKLGVTADPVKKEFVALTMCFHCHKVPQWWYDSGRYKTGNFEFRSDVEGNVYWDDPNNAQCKCTDQTGWVCKFNCGNSQNPKSLAPRGANCAGTGCRSPQDVCIYGSAPNKPPKWTCVPKTPFTQKTCRTYDASTGKWDNDPYNKASCTWYPGRKTCNAVIALP